MLFGNIILKASQWSILALLTKLTSTEAVGQFTFGLTISAPIFMFFGLDLRALLVTNTDPLHTESSFFRLRSIASWLAMAVILVWVWLFGQSISPEGQAIVLLVAFSKLIDSLTDIRLGLLQRNSRLDLVARLISLQGIITSAAFASTLLLTRSTIAGCASMLFCHVLGFIIATKAASAFRETPTTRPSTDASLLWTLARTALPLGTAMLLISLQTAIPRLFLERSHSLSSLGIFAALAYPWALGSLLVRSVGSAASPRYRILAEAKNWRRFASLAVGMAILCFMIGISGTALAWVGGATILQLLYTDEYAAFSYTFSLLGLSAAFGYIGAAFRHALVALRRLKSYLAITLSSSVILFWFSAFLIRPYGLNGAAYATLVMSAFQASASALLLATELRRAAKDDTSAALVR